MSKKIPEGTIVKCSKCNKKFKYGAKGSNYKQCPRCFKQYVEDHKDEYHANRRKKYADNKEESLAKIKKYRDEHPEIIRAIKQRDYANHRDKYIKYGIEYRQNNKDKISLRNKIYYENNKLYINKRQGNYQQNYIKRPGIREHRRIIKRIYVDRRRKIDPEFVIRENIRTRLRKAVISQATSKSNKTMKLIGCSISKLKNHIEKHFNQGMSWNKLLEGKIHLDHIIPLKWFDLTDPYIQKIAFNYLNIQPLFAKDNFHKQGKIDYKVIDKLLPKILKALEEGGE